MSDVEKVVNILKLKEKIKGIRFEYTIDDSFEAYIEKDDKIVRIEYNELPEGKQVDIKLENTVSETEDDICSCLLNSSVESVVDTISFMTKVAFNEWF